ncbi:dihydrofolate reductase [Fragilariopsis cylindrus CCMP1102]|uniref:Dihydrofolate reductase n=1 Tax=Fragilariopsis cylindrus CCMP1102 TaxID=635003 RepID=A0A1E7FTL2_9STRA|nr:dihydrofolate reductase [Fragilariopsis cylindrus CCMP1102]|eukprot:OEU21435.1 dihydrofolate reductase [Fragilariopsis cylindrus CCMP1102]
MKEYYNNNDHSNNDHSNNNNEKQEEEKVTAVSSIGSVGSTRFLHRCRPFVTITYAQSIDGKIALILDNEEEKVILKSNPKTKTTSSNFAISGPESLRLTHALRSIHDAILIGGKTLVIDNPRLNNRLWLLSSSSSSSSSNTNETEDTTYGNDTNNIPLLQVQQQQQQPRPVVLDTHLTYIRQLGNSIRAKNLIVCCSEDAYNKAIREGSYKHKTTNTHTSSNSILDISDVLLRLKDEFGIQSIMVEGGGFIISEFMNEKLFDYLCVTISPKLLGYHGYGYDLTSSSSSLGRLRCITLGEDSVLFSRVEQTI